MIREGMEVYAIAPHDAYSALLVENGCKFEPITIDNTGTSPVNDLKLTWELYKIYKKIKPDVILHFTIKPNIYGTIAARALKIPCINNVSGLGTIFLNRNYTTSIALFMYKLAFTYPKTIFFQNDFDRQVFLDLKLVNSNITEVLPGSGINIEHFRPAFHLENDEFTFLIVSRLIIDKGIIEYVKAAKILKELGVSAKFQILGAKEPFHKRGIPCEELVEWIENGLIEYLGTSKDVRPYIETADCIVLPSYREGTPRTLLEAGCLAKPIVTTNVPGCNNVVDDGYNGFLCNMKDPEDLAKKMLMVINLSDTERKIMGSNSRKKMEDKFDEKIVIQKYLDSIGKIRKPSKISVAVKRYIKERILVK